MKAILVCGARPNFMKIAPLLRAIARFNEGAIRPAAAEGPDAVDSPLSLRAKRGNLPRSLNHSPFTIHHSQITPLLVHTGQHYDFQMSQVFFRDLEIPEPDVYLGVGSGTHAGQTAKVMLEFEKVLLDETPDLVVVVGDVNSTLAAAIAAVKLQIPVAHVEAGLRSGDRTMPEEINRLLTDQISDYLFTPSPDADENLKKEGIAGEKIFFVGNVMIDSLLHNRPPAEKSDILERLGLLPAPEPPTAPHVIARSPDGSGRRGNLPPGSGGNAPSASVIASEAPDVPVIASEAPDAPVIASEARQSRSQPQPFTIHHSPFTPYALLTLHRPSNVDDRESLTRIMSAITSISERILVVFPAHPRTLKNLREFNLLPEGLFAIHDSKSIDDGAPPAIHHSPFTVHRLLLTPPLSYLDFLKLEMYARLVMTDSGGIQEETTVLNVPCLTLRENTERPITITQGTNVLVGTDPERIIEEAFKVLASDPDPRPDAVDSPRVVAEGPGEFDSPHVIASKARQSPPPPQPRIDLWDGHTAERIVQVLAGTARCDKSEKR